MEIAKIGVPAIATFFLGRLSTRLDRRRDRKEIEASRAPDFELTHESGNRFRLSNVGDADATDLTLDFGENYNRSMIRQVPDRVDLAAGESFTFLRMESFAVRRPDQVLVSCAELPQSQSCPVSSS